MGVCRLTQKVMLLYYRITLEVNDICTYKHQAATVYRRLIWMMHSLEGTRTENRKEGECKGLQIVKENVN